MALHQLRGGQGVPGACQEENRDGDLAQMLHPEAIRPAGRVQWIAVGDHTGALLSVGSEEGGHPPAHGTARQDQPFSHLGSETVGRGPVHRQELGLSVREGSTLRPVGVLEGHDPGELRQPGAQARHAGVIVAGPGSRGEQDPPRTRSFQAGGNHPGGGLQVECLHPAQTIEPGPDTVPGVKIIAHQDRDHLAESAADLIVEAIGGADGRLSLGLAGGSTPIETYRRLNDRTAEWKKVDAWMSDERWVPLDHPDCNGHQAATALIDHVGAKFHRPRWAPWLTPAEAAADFEEVLRALHPDGRADVILLGMGDDGHTASLFPHTAALHAPPDRWFVENHVPQLDTDRLTTTYSFLWAAHRVVFLVAGAGKAEALARVLDPQADPDEFPAAAVMNGESDVTWLVDQEAAADLSPSLLTQA